MKKILDSIADHKAQMQAILDDAKRENRSLTTSEQERFDTLGREAEMLHLQLRAMHNPLPEAQDPQAKAKRFAEQVATAVGEGRGYETSLRAIQNEATIHDVSTPVLYQDLQMPLEQGLILNRLGGQVLYNVQGEPMWPFVTGIEASVLGENDAVTDSNLTFTSVKSTPKRIAAHIPVSRRAINQSNLDLYGLVMREMGMGVARKLNKILCDTAAHGDYKGPFATGTMHTGTEVARKHATNVSLDDILGLEHAVLNNLTDTLGEPVFLMNYKMAQRLRATEVVKGQSDMLLTMHREGGHHYGIMCGRRVEFSNYVADDMIFCGDFKFLGLPQYGDVQIIVDPYTGAKQNTVLFTLNTEMDMVKIRKEAFALSKKP